MSTWGGLWGCPPAAGSSAEPAPSGSPRELDRRCFRSPGSSGSAGELGSLPPQRGKAALRWRSELPPKTAAGSSLPAGGATRQGALLAQRSGVAVLGLSPGGRGLPRATGWRPWPSPPTRQARQLGSAPAAPPPNCRVLRRMYSSGFQRYPSWAKRTRCAGPAPLLSRLGGGSRRRLRRSEHETAPALR